ncbi:hypothetical protein PHYPO_G00028260 [Pangasianodon hypophthalmus]|uniref:HAP1 N-terminal domain-containing protein n=1 Tax=Pangasianodon hypophthalmus TaxID=310915 RepID=A0A5N5MXP9_PANHP|nr:hypothetical protein PHYPO_G00028260 [Pangasianodon hypophthalmus]
MLRPFPPVAVISVHFSSPPPPLHSLSLNRSAGITQQLQSDENLHALLEPRASFTLNGEQEEGCGPLTQDLHLSPGNLRHGPLLVKAHKDVSTLTDVCSGVDLPEVEIVSLLAEELPRYTLRADHVFGYEHDDWLHTPLLPPEATLGLTYEQIDETLKYFLLCSERVGQVTKTYHDIEAVTHLLEEKERDLELAARIGQSLLKQNKALTERNELLDEQLEAAKEEIAQLRHELSMRDDLLQLYASTEEIEAATELRSPIRRNESTLLSATTSIMISCKRSSRVWRKRTSNCVLWPMS